MNDKEIYDKALKLWGEDKQIDMVIEECAELIVSINHYRRNRINIEDVITEIIDVEMMLEQLKNIINRPEIYRFIEENKKNRLIERVLKGK